MSKLFFETEIVVFEEYINKLSSDAFKVLMKLLYAAKTTNSDINIRSERSLRKVVGISVTLADSIWKELIDCELVSKRENKNGTVYTLNGRKIRDDNAKFRGHKEPRSLQVIVSDIKPKEYTENLTEKQVVVQAKKVLVDADDELIDLLKVTVELLTRHNTDKGKKFTSSELRKLLAGFVKFENSVIKETCYKYNNDGKIAGMRGYRYVLRIAEGIEKDSKNPNKNRKFAKEGYRIVEGKEIKKTTADSSDNIEQKRAGEIKFAIKLASGKVKSSVIYKRLLETDIPKLKLLYKTGCYMLEKNNNESNIYKGYDWL